MIWTVGFIKLRFIGTVEFALSFGIWIRRQLELPLGFWDLTLFFFSCYFALPLIDIFLEFEIFFRNIFYYLRSCPKKKWQCVQGKSVFTFFSFFFYFTSRHVFSITVTMTIYGCVDEDPRSTWKFESWNMICAKLEIFLGICQSELVQFWFFL